MKLSIGILSHNEGKSISNLINRLNDNLSCNYEIIIIDDFSEDEETKDILKNISNIDNVSIFQHSLNNDFASQKNFMNSKCSGKYIFNIDSDELVSNYILNNIEEIISINSNIELFYLPRVNIVKDILKNKEEKWPEKLGFNLTYLKEYYDDPLINWPDWQGRIYLNSDNIKWSGRVHERIIGHQSEAFFPQHPEYAIEHIKDLERQIRQNKLYSTIQR